LVFFSTVEGYQTVQGAARPKRTYRLPSELVRSL
jgi:hypothetical protein